MLLGTTALGAYSLGVRMRRRPTRWQQSPSHPPLKPRSRCPRQPRRLRLCLRPKLRNRQGRSRRHRRPRLQRARSGLTSSVRRKSRLPPLPSPRSSSRRAAISIKHRAAQRAGERARYLITKPPKGSGRLFRWNAARTLFANATGFCKPKGSGPVVMPF